MGQSRIKTLNEADTFYSRTNSFLFSPYLHNPRWFRSNFSKQKKVYQRRDHSTISINERPPYSIFRIYIDNRTCDPISILQSREISLYKDGIQFFGRCVVCSSVEMVRIYNTRNMFTTSQRREVLQTVLR